MNVSLSEILLVLFIALVVIKPEQIPEVARCLGQFIKIIQQLYKQIRNYINKLIDPGELTSHDKK